MGVRLAIVMTGILLCSLLITTYSYHESMLRVQSKTLTSIGFVLVGVFALLGQFPKGNWQYGAIVLLALITSFVGDTMLGMADYNRISSHNRYFIAGVVWFGIAHGFYSLVFGEMVGWKIEDLWVPALLVFIILIIGKLPWFDFRGCYLLVIGYTFILGLMVTKAIDFGLNGMMSAYGYRMVFAAVLFAFSDFLLIFKYFYKKPKVWITLMNLTCYYIAQVLFAVAILYL